MTAIILVIDDSEDDQRLYRRAFKDFDCALEMVSTAQAGLARIADTDSKHPRLILLDYNLPDMDGLSFIKRLAERSDITASIPIVMLTGESDTTVAVEAMKHGTYDYLVKDTGGKYLELLPGVAGRALTAHAQREHIRQLRQETETLLRRNQILMQNSMDGIHIMDMQGNIVEANDAFCRMLGYTPEEMARLNVTDWDAQWSAEELRKRFDELVGKGARFETVHRRKDGSLIDVEVSASGVKVEGQYFLYAASRDITGRKKTEAMLMQHKLVIDTSIDGFWVNDMLGNLREANEAYAKISGYTVEELVGMHISQLEAKEQAEDVKAHLAKIEAQGYDRFETRHRHKDGHEIDIEISATYMVEPPQLVVFCRDITERKKAEEAKLRASDLRFRGTMEQVGVGIVHASLDGYFKQINQKFCEIVGYARDELIHKDFRHIIFPDDLNEDIDRHIEQLLAGEIPAFSMEKRYVRKDRSLVWTNLTVSLLRDADNTPTYIIGVIEDITGRKHAEGELQETQLNLLAAQQLAKIGSWEWDVRNNTATWSDETYRLFEIDKGELNEHRKNFLDMVAPEDRIKVDRALSDALDGVKKYDIEYRVYLAGGKVKVIHALGETTRDTEGKVVAMHGTVQDITERKQVEVVVQQFGSLLQGSFNEIYMFDAESLHFILTSEGAEKNLGYSDDELNLLTPLDISPLFTLESFRQLVSPLWSGARQSLFFETVQRRKDGTTYPVEVSLQLMQNEHSTFLAVVQDVTERKQAEIKLHKFAEKIEDLYNNAPCGYHSLDKDGTILMINETELAWLGYARDEVIGKMKLTDLLTPESRQTFHETFPQFMKLGFIHDIELELIRKDGTVLSGLISATAIYDPDGNFVMSRSTLADITGLKRVEQQLRDLTAHIQSVREEEKAGIAREIHDDLGGTLTALKIETYWLKTEQPKGREAAPFLEHVESMSKLIDNAMGVMRNIITGLRPTILDDLGLLAALEWQAAQFHKHTGIECRVNCVCATEEDCAKELDKARSIALFRIVQEALNNVAKHSGASQVEIEFHQSDEEVVMSIIDNGHGMAESCPKTRKPDVSIPYGILGMCERADQLGGQISFDTPPGGGVCVTVILPLFENDEETA